MYLQMQQLEKQVIDADRQAERAFQQVYMYKLKNISTSYVHVSVMKGNSEKGCFS